MFKYCPECGGDLTEDFKFCPYCGYQLNKPRKEEPNTGIQTSEVIICGNCGEENSAENNLCINCGIKLKGEKLQKKDYKNKETSAKKEKQISRSQNKKQSKTIDKPSPTKQLELKNILIIGIGIIGVGLIILLLSGVFDKTDSNIVNQTTNTDQNQSTDINPATIQRINELEEKVKADSSDTETLLQLAHLRNDSGFYEEAITNYKKYLNKVPDNADARVDMGVCYFNLEKYDDAKREMTKALEYKPDHQIAHLNLGIVNLASGNLEESKKWFKKALELDPDSEVGKRAQELLQSH